VGAVTGVLTPEKDFFDKLNRPFGGGFLLRLHEVQKAANVSGDPPPVFLDFPHVLCYNEKNSSKSDALIFFEK